MTARVIEEELGVNYHPAHVRRLVHRIGFSVQRLRRAVLDSPPGTRDRGLQSTAFTAGRHTATPKL